MVVEAGIPVIGYASTRSEDEMGGGSSDGSGIENLLSSRKDLKEGN